MMNKKHLDEQYVLNQYRTRSAPSIAKELGVSISPIYAILKKHNASRSPSETNKMTWQKLGDWENKKILTDLYINQEMSILDIAEKFNVRKAAIMLALKRFDIPRRTTSEALNTDKSRNKRIKIIKSSWDDNKKAHYSSLMKRKWKDSEFRKSIMDPLSKTMQTDEYRNKMREIIKKRHQNPEYAKKIGPLISIGLKKAWKDEKLENWQNNAKNLLAKSSRKRWQDPVYKEKMAIVRQNQPKISSQQKDLYSILEILKIRYVKEHRIGFYVFDCFLPDHNILIEVQGDYWHSLPNAKRNDKAKATYIGKYFPNYKLKYIWEHEFKCQNRIIELIKYWTNTDIRLIDFDFKKTIMKNIATKEASEFIAIYHYLFNTGNAKHRFGFFDDGLIGLITYGPITRKESADRLGIKSDELLELTRLCVHPQRQKKNFASYMIGKTIKYLKRLENKPKCLISFADSTFNHYGTIYKASNWKLDGTVKPSYWYVDKDGYVMHKKTLWNHAKSLKMAESDFAAKNGYRKVMGKEKYRYLFYL